VVALISLALGIGANTAILSFLDAVMLRSLPVKNPQICIPDVRSRGAPRVCREHGSRSSNEVIGVAKDVKFMNLGEPIAYIDYLPYTQRTWGFGDFEVRYSGDFSAIARDVQQAIHSVDRRLPIIHITTLDEQVARSFTNETIIAELSAFFALVAVFLSCIGLYGLMSYLVSRRTGEIGIRLASAPNAREWPGR
jgi:hypothetical protein